MLFNTNEKGTNRMSMASLSFHSLQYYESLYTSVLIPFQLAIFIYKYNSLPYQNNTKAGQVILLIIAFILNMIRHRLGRSGNRSKNVGKIIAYVILSVIIIMGFVYLIVWQPYIYWLEFIMALIAIILIALEFLLALIALIVFKVSE